VTEMPGESTLRKNFQQLQEGEGRRTPNPLYHAQPAFFPADKPVPARPRGQQLQPPLQVSRNGHNQQQQQQHRPGHQEVCASWQIWKFLAGEWQAVLKGQKSRLEAPK